MEISRFSVTQILREISFVACKRSKTAKFTIGALIFVNLGKFQPLKIAKTHKISKFIASKCGKMANFARLQPPKVDFT